MNAEDVRDWCVRLLGSELVDAEPLSGGKNNRIFGITLADGRTAVAKCYLLNPSDTRDRCGAEYSAHSFLWSHGVRSIAEPLARAGSGEVSFYSRIHGERPASIDEDAIDQAVAFAGRLVELSELVGAQNLPLASEAAFSAPQLLHILEHRLLALRATADEGGGTAEFRSFVNGELSAEVGACRRALTESPLELFVHTELPREERLLSPSDFGFHNALRDTSGRWHFLDFEYFGWDDPAKLVCDFLLHPGMNLTAALRNRFRGGILKRLSRYRELQPRIDLLLPCFRAKWSMIMLNEFQRDHRRRREFSSGAEGLDPRVLASQLAKSRAMLSGTTEK